MESSSQSLGQRLAGPFAQMWAGGEGPTLSALKSAFDTVGIDSTGLSGNMQEDVRHALAGADDHTAVALATELMDLLAGIFDGSALDSDTERRVRKFEAGLAPVGVRIDQGRLDWSDVTNLPYERPTPTERSRRMSPAPTAPGGLGRGVFLVHGRNHAVKAEFVKLLRAFDLRIIDWNAASTEAATATGHASPYTLDIVQGGLRLADAVVVLMTPDDLGRVRPEFLEDRDGDDERRLSGQARMNVIFEAGMALGTDPARVVIVEIDRVRAMSDIAGVNTVRFDGSVGARRALSARLAAAGLTVDTDNDDWHTAGTFPTPAIREEGSSPMYEDKGKIVLSPDESHEPLSASAPARLSPAIDTSEQEVASVRGSFRDERSARQESDRRLFESIAELPSWETLDRALSRATSAGLVSARGPRTLLSPDDGLFVRFSVEGGSGDWRSASIGLTVEDLTGRTLARYFWPEPTEDDASVPDVIAAFGELEDALGASGYHPGHNRVEPEAALTRLANLVLTAHQARASGRPNMSRLIQIDDEWAITDAGVVRLDKPAYLIPKGRLGEDWTAHIMGKQGLDPDSFDDTLIAARELLRPPSDVPPF